MISDIIQLRPGMRIWFEGERNGYTIRACNSRYLICTKPFNLKKRTVIYTIVDLERGIRGIDGYVFSPYDYYNQKDCEQCLADLVSGEIGVSRRHIDLKITKIH